MSIKTPFRNLIYPFLLIAGTFGLTLRFGRDWDTYIMQMFGSWFALIWEIGLIGAAWIRTGYYYADDGARKPIFDKPPRPPLRDFNAASFQQMTTAVKIDCVRAFNRTLIEQRNGNLEVNLSEKFWLEKAEGEDAHRWNKIGGRGRNDLVDMLERGVKFGAYKKVGGQGKRVPDDWRKIRDLERGTPLPHYSPIA